jgi:predicted dehydrogenase
VSNPSAAINVETVNVAVVGLGFMGVTHLQTYLDHPKANVVAVCGSGRLPVNGVLSGVAGNIRNSGNIQLGPDVKAYSKIADLLADPRVHLVDICTPTPVHQEQVIAALIAGKHVICEKPLARSSDSAREILRAAAVAPGYLMPAMCMRFWPGWSWLKQAVEDQTYGKVLAARFRRDSAMPAWSQQGIYTGGQDLGGALFDLHIHDVDFINHLFGRPAGVFSTGVLAASGTINHVITQYDYPGGPSVSAEGSWLLNQGFNMCYTLFCEQATIDFDLARGAGALIVSQSGQEPRVVETGDGDGYSREIDYIVECVAKRQAPSVVSALDGVTALEICEAEEKSIRSSAPVKL